MMVSIVIIVKNESKYIKNCLEALLKQSYQEFEIIAVDNGSTDRTGEIINSLEDKRIKYFYEPSKYGIAKLRNFGVMKAIGEYIFFTDADCIPNSHWLEEGLKVLETKEYVGVEGKTYYEFKQKITISDSNTCQFIPGEFMTCNVAYTRNILKKVNYFDPDFKHAYEDRDFAFRVMKLGNIHFSQDMLVSHQQKKLSVKALFNRVKRVENMVYFIKKHGRYAYPYLYKYILWPKELLFILCPPLIFLTQSYSTFNDLIIGFLKFALIIYGRILILKAAIKNRIFVI